MKNNAQKDYNLVKIFIISFVGMLLFFTFVIKSFTPSVDVSIGDYKQEENETQMSNIDGRLSMIQEEDRGKSFSDLMQKPEDVQQQDTDFASQNNKQVESKVDAKQDSSAVPMPDPVYKVYIGSYSSAEQAKVAKDIIQESGSNLNPIVKCLGSNNYTLQVGIFKNKNSAEALLFSVQQNHLPGRIVQEQ